MPRLLLRIDVRGYTKYPPHSPLSRQTACGVSHLARKLPRCSTKSRGNIGDYIAHRSCFFPSPRDRFNLVFRRIRVYTRLRFSQCPLEITGTLETTSRKLAQLIYAVFISSRLSRVKQTLRTHSRDLPFLFPKSNRINVTLQRRMKTTNYIIFPLEKKKKPYIHIIGISKNLGNLLYPIPVTSATRLLKTFPSKIVKDSFFKHILLGKYFDNDVIRVAEFFFFF